MPDSDLLNIDPDVLFQQHSISEIGDIQKKLLHEIERKKEELRIMVGERYRDLIEAADTIAEMKTTANLCVNRIDEMTVTCRKLHDTHLIGFKNDTIHESIERPIVNKSVHAVAAQIKLLMTIPEQIWSFVDKEDFLKASQLFLFARHIYFGLKHATGVQHSVASNLIPVIDRQWNTISNFNESLIQACRTKLENESLTVEVAASCLASMHLLDSNNKMIDLMNTVIKLHSTNSISIILNKDIDLSVSQSNIKDDIKHRILVCVTVIIKTLRLIYNCFVENNGLIVQQLDSVYEKDSPALLSLLNFNDPIGLKMLPPVVSEYRLKPLSPLTSLKKDEIFKCLSDWMNWIQNYLAERVVLLLKYVNSGKSLHSIREKAMCIETPSDWEDICIALFSDSKSFDIWSYYFQPLITQRLKIIITTKWSNITTTLKEKMKKLLESITNLSSTEKETNINWFVWNDLISQSFISSEDNIINSVNSLMKGMSMQDRGFTPNLEKICESFDEDLCMLLNDLNEYLYVPLKKYSAKELTQENMKSNIDRNEALNFCKYSDRVDIEKHLRECSMNNINNIIQFINEELIGMDLMKDNSSTYIKSSSILSARFLQAIPMLIPNLRFCFIPSQIRPNFVEDYQVTDSGALDNWDTICKLLNSNCNDCWMHWLRDAEKRIEEHIKIMPQEFTLTANMDYILVQWDAINIEEKDDQDQIVTSTIKIPSGPSIKMQELIYSTSRVLDEVVPHTLPKKIHMNFIEMVAEKIIHYLSNIIKDKIEDINQKCALQLLMDVRHVTLLLVTRENKNLLNESNEICELLKEKIDPFDYNVFYPRIQVNVKRSVQRVQTLFGSLIPNSDLLNSIIGNKPLTSGGTADRDPNSFILATQGSASVAWFPLLPITAPISSNKKQTDKQRKKQTQSSSPISQKVLSNQEMSSSTSIGSSNTVRSSAAAFFESVASDWFGNYNQ